MLSFTESKRLVDEMFTFGSYEDADISKIIALLQLADDLYFNDEESFIEDSQYDALKQYAQRVSPANVYFTGVGSEVRGGKVPLPYTMGSLNQVYQGDFEKWVNRYSLAQQLIVITDKLDGASNMMVYDANGQFQIAFSRGDGVMGADISRHFRKMSAVPKQIAVTEAITVRAETIISPERFKQALKTPSLHRVYKNPRNMVSGLMNSSAVNEDLYQYIDVVAYEIVGSTLSKLDQLKLLKQLGFSVVRHTSAVAADLSDDRLTELLNQRRKTSPYELDGIVLDVNDATIRQAIRGTELNPECSVKFKVADSANYAVATVKEVEWNVSKDGYWKPRVKIHPVDLVGVTIQHATGFNAKFIKDNNIGPGAKIAITRSGDVIPFILRVIEPAEAPQLPDGDNVWTETGVDLVLADVTSNETVRFEQLNDFFASIDVPHLGDGNLMKMFEMGFDQPEKIIPLTQEDIGSLVGSLAIGKKIFKSIRDKFTNIPLYELMGAHPAFGRGVGVRKMKKLYDAFKGDMTKCADVDAIVAVEGFERKTATKVANGYAQFQAFMDAVTPYITVAPYVAPVEGALTGKTFVFTGLRNKDLEQAIVSKGGLMGSAVSSKTTFLVTAEPNSTSGKATKARELGVTVISVDDLKSMLK